MSTHLTATLDSNTEEITVSTKQACTLDVCVDCLFYLANGEVTDGEGNDITAEHRAAMVAVWGEDFDITLGAIGESSDDGEVEPWFSWSQCDGCGSMLGGNREHATAWI